MAKPISLYWDACAWLGLLNAEADKMRELEIIYNIARDGKIELWTSTQSMIECRRLAEEVNAPRPYDDEGDKKISAMFGQSFVKPIPMGFDIVEEGRRIWRETAEIEGAYDAIHIASALRWDVEVMHTYDRDDLIGQSGVFSCRNGNKLKICYPDETTDGPLFGYAKQTR